MEKTWSIWFARQADVYSFSFLLSFDKLPCSLKSTSPGIYPLHDVHIRKVKVMKRPRFDLNKLMDMHGEGSGEYKLELGMWSRILWDPPISTRTTLLFLPVLQTTTHMQLEAENLRDSSYPDYWWMGTGNIPGFTKLVLNSLQQKRTFHFIKDI